MTSGHPGFVNQFDKKAYIRLVIPYLSIVFILASNVIGA
jgi:hypothetical protein